MSPERDAAREGARLAVGLLYLLGRAKVEGLALGALARAERCAHETAARALPAALPYPKRLPAPPIGTAVAERSAA